MMFIFVQELHNAKLYLNDLTLRQSKNPLSREAYLITSMRIHPLIAKIILIWTGYDFNTKTMNGRPLFPILVFVSIIHSFERTPSETKEHGLKEIDIHVASVSKYGEAMERTLSIILRTRQVDSEELGRTGTVLKRLIMRAREFFGSDLVNIGLFDLNRFTSLLATLLKENFPNEVLSRIPASCHKTGMVLFRNIKHPQIIWRILNDRPFTEIFPIISMLERNGNRVLLYVPLQYENATGSFLKRNQRKMNITTSKVNVYIIQMW